MALLGDFTSTMKDHFSLYPVFPLPQTLRVGDYGVLDNNGWRYHGNLMETLRNPIKVVPTSQGGTGKYEFASHGVSATKVRAGVSINVEGFVTVKPSLLLEFSDDFGLYFAASGCKWNTMKNMQAVGDELVRRALLDEKKDADYWDHGRFHVVTGVIESATTTLILANKRGAKMLLSAKADVPYIDMADVDLSLQVDIEREVYFKLVTDPGKMTPLVQLHHVNHSLIPWEKDQFTLTKGMKPGPDDLRFSPLG